MDRTCRTQIGRRLGNLLASLSTLTFYGAQNLVKTLSNIYITRADHVLANHHKINVPNRFHNIYAFLEE